MKIRPLNPQERLALAPARGAAWHGALTEEQFVARNQALYGGAFGRDRIQSYGVFVSERPEVPVASCDFVQGEVFSREGGRQRVDVLASVLTLPKFERRGLATELLRVAFAELKGPGLLYSDIGASFYRRHGFAEDSWAECFSAVPSTVTPSEGLRLVTAEAFQKGLANSRMEAVKSGFADVAFLPDTEWIHWVEAKYDFYRSISGNSANHPSLVQYGVLLSQGAEVPVAFMEDPLKKILDVLWADPRHLQAWKPVAFEIAHARGLGSIRYWDRNPAGRPTWPMYHPMPAHPTTPQGPASRLELALGDWW